MLPKNRFIYMRILLFALISILPNLTLKSQESTVKSGWTSYCQYVKLTDSMRNSKYRISASIKADSIGKNARAGLWTRVDDDGFFQNDAYNEKIVINEEWKRFTIVGTIDSTETALYFGVFVENNGVFYFDDFKLEIQKDTKEWKNVPIKNHSFENASDTDWIEGTHVEGPIRVENFDISFSDKEQSQGRYSLRIEGKDIIGNDKNGRFAEVNNVGLYYEIYGEGEPLVLIHGNGQSMGAFINQVEEFSKQYKVILVDSRGRGNSTYDEDVDLTYSLQADDIKLFLDYLKIDQAHVVGWSDGAIIGLILALKYPEKIKKLVSMAANIFPKGIKDYRQKELREDLVYLEKEGAEKLTLDLYHLLLNYPQLEFDDLKKIKAATLIMAGDQDVIKNSHTLNIFEHIQNAQLAILPNETHYLPEENPALFNEIVLKFLNSKE